MKTVLSILFIFMFLLSPQELKEETIYIQFNSHSNKVYSYETSNGKYAKEMIYRKEKKGNGNYHFYIGKELFSFNSKKNIIDTCSVEKLKHISFTPIKKAKKKVDKTNGLYPYKVFNKVFLVEKINDSVIVKYDVKWEYYIE